MRGWGAFELALERSRLVESKLKALAKIKTAMLVGCAACIDVHSPLGRQVGLTEEQLRDLAHYRDSSSTFSLAGEACLGRCRGDGADPG